MSEFRLLIVDDEEDLRDVLAHQLKALGAEIETAENGRVALEKVKSNQYDAILSDISMPEMNGLELLSRIREAGIDTPFVFITGYGDKVKAVEALRLGAFDFLEKPWEPERLRSAVRSALDYGSKLRGLAADLEDSMKSSKDLPDDQKKKIEAMHKALHVLKLTKHMAAKKSA